jgi:hypothetical protein
MINRRPVPSSRLLMTALIAAAFVLVAGPGFALVSGTVVSCPFSGIAGDTVGDEGIVVSNYQGTNVRLLRLGYGALAAGIYHVTAQIHRGSFDGPLVGTSTIFINMPGGSFADVNAFFDFGGAPVTPGDTLAITQTVTGPGVLAFDVGTGGFSSTGNCGGAYETTGTSPPLDSERRATVGIEIDQDHLDGASCIPSDSLLCIDNATGDRRFKVNINFSHAGGSSGAGGAIPLASLGITHGGAFWFFSPDNPEMLVKVLNACGVNDKFWIFATAGTNVAFTLHVEDTTTLGTKTYTNADNTVAVPVQDTSAFSCGTPVSQSKAGS